MPVLNGERYLKEAIESILHQTLNDLEFIIINDGSIDKTGEILDEIKDERVKVITHPQNWGLSKSINQGIKLSGGMYIARMDADDLSLPQRLASEVNFLEQNPLIGIIGSAAIMINEKGERMGQVSKPLSHKTLKWQSLFSTPLLHPTIMARSEVLKNNLFDETFHNSEDYELWSRLIFERNIEIANLKEPLLYYRVTKKSFTQTLNTDHKTLTVRNMVKNIEHYATLSENEKNIILKHQQGQKLAFLDLVSIWKIYKRAYKEFAEREKFSPPLLPYFINLLKYKIKQYLI